MTAAATPRNLAMMNIGRCTGLLRTVMMVLSSNSLATAPEAEKIAMNKLVRNSVDRPISRKSLLSSLIVYMARDGLMKSNSRAAAMIMEYIGCLSVSMKVFLAIVSNLFISHYHWLCRRFYARSRVCVPKKDPIFFHNSPYTKVPLIAIVRNL